MQEYRFGHRHLLGIEGLTPDDISHVLDLADGYVELNRQAEKKNALLRGRTLINCFFENSTRTRTSFEVAGKRLGADVINMAVRVVAPCTLLPAAVERLGVEVFHDMTAGLKDVDIVMMLRLQVERMHGSFVPSTREYFHFFGLDYDKLKLAKPDALIMHPGPMNRGVEIGSEVADDIDRSLIRQQVEMGVAVRMACLEIMTDAFGNNPPIQ